VLLGGAMIGAEQIPGKSPCAGCEWLSRRAESALVTKTEGCPEGPLGDAVWGEGEVGR
jgi:hypothetical protein